MDIIDEDSVAFVNAAPQVGEGDDQPAGVERALLCGFRLSFTGDECQRAEHEQVLVGPRLPARLVSEAHNQRNRQQSEDWLTTARKNGNGAGAEEKGAEQQPVKGSRDGREAI